MSSPLQEWYRGKRVFVTGHTGFKGAWLVAWLRAAGASVVGYALPPLADRPSLFSVAHLENGIESVIGDIRATMLADVLARAAPEIVLHLAAQSLVRTSYRDPVETYETNVIGTARLLEAVRSVATVRAVVVVTSDKCYESRLDGRGHAEDGVLGGHDPYSSSKACAELVTSAMRRSFFSDGRVAVASARAGNVIGGGDWADDRVIPDLVRAAHTGVPATLRHPTAVRPWQFVLDPLRGYLMLGRALVERGSEVAGAWNFGPHQFDLVSVGDLVDRVQQRWPRVTVRHLTSNGGPHETGVLALDCTKARQLLGWEPILPLDSAVHFTVSWYRAFYEGAPGLAASLVDDQVDAHECAAESVARAI